ncbi:MAG: GHKL domain-containing protein, partial [Planctomycetaceae bacterium]|nr:GHKL domain-containing protein [Planctomycetaceae bacterium]
IAAQQSQLLHVSRLSSMGQMVAVISHEITQPLAAIANYSSACELLAEQPTPDIGKLRAYLEAITEQSARAGQILGRVRNFVKHSVEHRIQTDLIQLAKDSLKLISADLRSRQISVTSTFPNQAVFASVDPVQIQQVLVNLIANASDAVGSQPTHQRKIAIRISADDECVTFEVTDSGSGLPPDSQHQLFDPFYTSKPDGMGMGLSICSDILRSHSGTITAENAPNAGAKFRFTLPRSEEVSNE